MSDFDSGDLLAELFGVSTATAPAVEFEPGAFVAEMTNETQAAAWDADCIDWPEPCPKCGSLEMVGRVREGTMQ